MVIVGLWWLENFIIGYSYYSQTTFDRSQILTKQCNFDDIDLTLLDVWLLANLNSACVQIANI